VGLFYEFLMMHEYGALVEFIIGKENPNFSAKSLPQCHVDDPGTESAPLRCETDYQPLEL
jgi:hypothetical protein